jgi:transcriptional regulator with XRE-family HTH domain
MSLKSRWRPERLPEKLRQIRKALDLSQSEMLQHLGIANDFHPHTISSYETGRAEPPLPVLLLYARAATKAAGEHVSTDVLIDDRCDLPKKLSKKIQSS